MPEAQTYALSVSVLVLSTVWIVATRRGCDPKSKETIKKKRNRVNIAQTILAANALIAVVYNIMYFKSIGNTENFPLSVMLFTVCHGVIMTTSFGTIIHTVGNMDDYR